MPLLVVVPYVQGKLSSATVRTVKLSGWAYTILRLPDCDPGAYGRLVRNLWAGTTDVIICEQDVEPSAGQLADICTCGHDWCGYNYDDGRYPDGPMFGLVRLSRRLQVRHPMAAEVALVIGKRRDVEAEWWRVDSLMARDLMIRGEHWTAHPGRVHHAHCGPVSGPM
jgi:hypothetical protein